MKNIKMNTAGNILTIEIDLSQEQGRSKSGKTMVVASTLGNKKIDGTDVTIGINAYK